MRDYSHRHPATQQIMRWFQFDHLPEGPIRHTAHVCAMHADGHVSRLPDGPELTTGLRKLLEAKDCLVRATIDAMPDPFGGSE